MALTLYGRNQVVSSQFSAARYIAVHTGNPTDSGAANESTDPSYARQSNTMTANTGNGSASNSADVTFTFSSVTTITHVSVWDAATAGNCLSQQAFAAPINVTAGSLVIPLGELIVGGGV